ncbi:MAG: right-handed parallel beta-helix repeat-containing protein [Anaerolineales bacterium]|nr:right-handed parallel beta-helix repeat-containing protein [Anaerolineales bacterium]
MYTHRSSRIITVLLISLALTGLMISFLFIKISKAADETFWVNSAGDSADVTAGDCICATSGDFCTLRAAIEEANICSGGQTIRFDSGITMTISPATPLPAIVDDYTVIDGSDMWYDWSDTMVPGVMIDGASLAANGLEIKASHCVIYGLEIVNFGYSGVYVSDTAEDNHIGGGGTYQRNVITKNGHNGVLITGANAKSNVVSSNYVGTNAKGYYELNGGNGHHGVSVWYGEGNVITGNLIAYNKWSGATMDAVDSGSVTDNHIGMDIAGGSLPNTYYGVHIGNGAKPQVTNNHIAFNKRGILVEGGSQAVMEGNDIYDNDANSLGTPVGGGVLITGAGSRAEIYENNIHDNAAIFGGGVAIENGADSVITENNIQENEAVRYTTGYLGGAGIYANASTVTVTLNTIISNTVTGENGSTIRGYADGGGILFENATSGLVTDNEIRGNTATGYTGNSGGVGVINSPDIQMFRNVIVNNAISGTECGGSGIGIFQTDTTPGVRIDANRIENNIGSNSGAIWLLYSDYVTLTNNLIVNNIDTGLSIYNCGNHIQSNFNTISMNDDSGIVINDAHLYLYNTLVISNTGYGIEKIGATWSMALTRNDVWGNSLGASSPSASFYLEVDPLFFGQGFGAFALRPGSPCIDVGDYGHPESNSYNNIPRPVGVGYDIGAYEMPVPTYLPVLLR